MARIMAVHMNMFRNTIARLAAWLKRHPTERADALETAAALAHARAERLERAGRIDAAERAHTQARVLELRAEQLRRRGQPAGR